MAQIDVTELLTDPDFVDPIVIINRYSTINDSGENVLQESPFKSVGSVQPASEKTIQRLPEALRVANLYSFWVKGDIRTGDGRGKYPDIISYRGKRFQVTSVADWTNWGQGFSQGTCVAEKPTG